jgi:hypothetical protein
VRFASFTVPANDEVESVSVFIDVSSSYNLILLPNVPVEAIRSSYTSMAVANRCTG